MSLHDLFFFIVQNLEINLFHAKHENLYKKRLTTLLLNYKTKCYKEL
jgi:hypothetical protein